MKEKFTSDEWELLKIFPFQIFVVVAGADLNIDEKEIEQFNKDLHIAPFYKDPLHKELFIDILSSDITKLLKKAMDVSKLVEHVNKIKNILKAKLTIDEYQRFTASMFVNAVKVAQASGGSIFGGNKISDEEKRALLLLAGMFELDPGSIKKFFS
jgi:hypothetical protein